MPLSALLCCLPLDALLALPNARLQGEIAYRARVEDLRVLRLRENGLRRAQRGLLLGNWAVIMRDLGVLRPAPAVLGLLRDLCWPLCGRRAAHSAFPGNRP